jgi:hypothetical protein
LCHGGQGDTQAKGQASHESAQHQITSGTV